MMEFGDFLANTGSEIRYLPQEPPADDREHHMAVVKDVVNKFKLSLKGKPRLWFEMQYPTSADEPKTKEAYEKMIASFITEHNTIGSIREQQIMAWKTLNWNPVQERLDDFVYRLRRIGQELGKTADEQLDYFKCSVPQHLYLYHKDATTIKEAMENIKRACALGGVPVVAPVDTRTTQSVPFMQMTDSQDYRNVPRNSDDVKISGFQFQGKIDYLDDCVTKIVEMFEKNNKRLIEEIKTSKIIEIAGTVEVVETAVEEVIRVIQTQVQKMIDIGLEVEMTLEVGLEVEEDQANPVLIATSPTMIFLTVTN